MPMYVVLMQMTDEGVKNVKGAPQRLQEGIKAFEGMGGKVHVMVATMGEYDYVGVGEAPSDEVAAAFAAALASRGFVRTTSMRAFTPEEFAALLSKLP
jgi:uncharacterized protein with GYD domain